MKTTTSETAQSKFLLLPLLKVHSIVFKGYLYWNICRGGVGQDICRWDHSRTWTCSKRYDLRCRLQRDQFFHRCCNSRYAAYFSRCIHTEIFAEGFRDKVFDYEIIATLGRALGHTDSIASITGAVEFFTAAMAQGALCCFHGILTPKYLQRGFGIRYLILRSSPH